MNFQITAAFPTELQGDQWEVIFLQEGPFVDGQHHITRAALEDAQAKHLFDNVYVQELRFRDGTTRHLPTHLANDAPGGVFGDVVAVTRNTVLKVLENGKAAIVGVIDAIDDNWKAKMRNIAQKGLKLPGLSFNALAQFANRTVAAGQSIRDITRFDRIDTFEVVSYPNAGGQILRCVASEEPAAEPPQILSEPTPITTQDRIQAAMDKTQLIQLIAAFKLPLGNVDGEPGDILGEAMATPEYKSLDPESQAMLAALQEALTAKADAVVEKLVMALTAKTKAPEVKPADAPAPVQAGRNLQAEAESMIQKFEARLAASLQAKEAEFERKLKAQQAEQQRLVAAQELVQKSTLPESMKPLALKSVQGAADPKVALDEWIKALAPLSEAGKVQAAMTPLRGISMGLDTKDKKEIALMKLVGAVPSDTEKPVWKDVPSFRSLGHAFTHITGMDAYNMTLEEFSNPSRIRADINMFEIGSFPNLLGNTLNRTVVDIYNEQTHLWSDFCVQRKGVKDFKSLRMNRIGGFGVPLAKYADVASGQTSRYTGGIDLLDHPSEQEGTYSVETRANQWMLTYETLRNDDIGALNTWLRKFAESCDDTSLFLTLRQFINANAGGTPNAGTITLDSKALYHADHGNIMTEELSYEALRTACRKLRMQTDRLGSNKPLNLQPVNLVAPESLRDVVETLLETDKRPMSNDNDKNTMGFLNPIILHDFWLGDSAKNWFITGDLKRESSAFLECAFLDDKSTPTILTNNTPENDLMFTHLRTVFSGIYIFGVGTRAYETVVGSFPA